MEKGSFSSIFLSKCCVADKSLERREILFSGNVQGVGFRFTTRSIAANYEVVGFVCNLADGRVQLCVEGMTRELDRFQADLAERMASYIQDMPVDVRPGTHEFGRFEIRY